MHLTVHETRRALSAAGVKGLYARNRRDSIVLFALQKGLSVMETNELPDAFEEAPLE